MALTLLAVYSCARTGAESELSATVVSETVLYLPGGGSETTRVTIAGARVYLLPSDAPMPATLDSASLSWKNSDDGGHVTFDGVEGYYNLFVDRDGDQTIDAVRKNVPSGGHVTVVLRSFEDAPGDLTGPTEPSDPSEPQNPGTVGSAHGAPVLSGIWINGGAAEVTGYDVHVTVAASNAVEVSFAEEIPSEGVRVPFRSSLGYRFSFGQGTKTLYVIAYGAEGSMAGPVSATVVVKTHPPYPPIASQLAMEMNPPGTSDVFSGMAGAVEGGNRVRVYRDRDYAHLVTEVGSLTDGSIPPVLLGDNVADKDDYLYVTNVDVFGRESASVWISNDTTPPKNFKLDGVWENLYAPADIGNRGETFYTIFEPRVPWEPVDFSGGVLYLPPFGGPATEAIRGPNYQVSAHIVPNDFLVDTYGRIEAVVWDEAGNVTFDYARNGVAVKYFELNARPPRPVSSLSVLGGNRALEGRWNEENADSESFVLEVLSPGGAVVQSSQLPVNCQLADSSNLKACFAQFNALANCRWYSLRLAVVDRGGNVSLYSTSATALVIVPTPRFSAWGGLGKPWSGRGTLYFSFDQVAYANAYELLFSEQPGPPYLYDSGTGATSPTTYTSLEEVLGGPSINHLPYGTKYYLSMRAWDGSCPSDYAPEVTAATDLRTIMAFDGAEGDVMGSAVATARGGAASGMLVGSAGRQEASLVSTANGMVLGTLGTFRTAPQLDLPGSPMAIIDVERDGRLEYLVGSPVESPGGLFMAGSAYLYSNSGTLIRRYDGDATGLQLGHAVQPLGDLNADGYAEFAVGSLGCEHRDCLWDGVRLNEGPSQVLVIDGQSLTPWRVHPGHQGDLLGAALAGGVDLDGDGVGDYAAGAPGAVGQSDKSYVEVFSGATGLGSKIFPVDPSRRFGAAVTMADVGGLPMLFVGAPALSDTGSGRVHGYRYEGGNWASVWDVDGSLFYASSRFGTSLLAAGQIAAGGRPSLVVGAPGNIQDYSYGHGRLYVLDAATGTIQYEVRGTGCDGALGYGLATLPQLNFFPRQEWLATAPGSVCNGIQSGRIYLFTTDTY